ncbi:MAG: hypothetical protein KIS80_09530 [Anaerolineales bacterium]|nr:hypothetical protein [Anaerolineales bacterium]
MKNENVRLLRLYFGFGVVEALLALLLLTLLPADPKNIWLLGFSKLRFVFAVTLLLLVLGFGWLAVMFGRQEKHKQWAGKVERVAAEYPAFGPTILLAFGLVFFVPYMILLSPNLSMLDGVLTRILPIVALLFTRLLQASITWFRMARIQTNEVEAAKDALIRLDARKIAVYLSGIALLIIFASVSMDILEVLDGPQQFSGFRVKFDLDQEANVPTYYSSFLLLTCAALLAIIGLVKTSSGDGWSRHWNFLALGFFFLSLDETAAMHERLIRIFRDWFNPTGLFYFGWVLAAIPLLIMLGMAYYRFFLSLPQVTRRRLFLAVSVFVAGAIGMEMLGGWFEQTYGAQHPAENVLTTIEESLELFGVILLIHALLTYMADSFKELRFKITSSI